MTTLLLFCTAALVLLVVPGPAVFYILARSVNQGARAGLVSVAGIHTGTLVHVVAAVGGLSALLVSSATAFTAVKFAGAAYLLYLGIKSIWAYRQSRKVRSTIPEVAPRSMRRVFFDGVIVNVLNPKTAVFFLAFVPQFVDPSAGHAFQLVLLGAVFILLGILSDGAYAVIGAWLGRRLRRMPVARGRTQLVAGTAYLGIGAATAVAGSNARS